MELNCRVLLPAAEMNQLRTERLDFHSGDPVDHSVLCIDFSQLFLIRGGMNKPRSIFRRSRDIKLRRTPDLKGGADATVSLFQRDRLAES
jgi:hypothetical protein